MIKPFSIREFFPDPALPLAVHRRTAQRPKELHAHDFSELVLILGGDAVHFTEKDEHGISRGDVFVIQGELAHAAALVTQLELEAQERMQGYIFTATALFMQLTSFLARCYDGKRTPESRVLLRIGATIGYLEDHFADPISIEQLTRIAGMSESSLLRAFKQATGRAPTQYLLDLRLRRARHLLRYTGLNVTEIAFQTGFNDSNCFARQFRKGVGASPREYRKRFPPTAWCPPNAGSDAKNRKMRAVSCASGDTGVPPQTVRPSETRHLHRLRPTRNRSHRLAIPLPRPPLLLRQRLQSKVRQQQRINPRDGDSSGLRSRI